MQEIDLNIFRAAFFDEAMEHVADIESALLELEGNTGDPELLNRIFRAAHSIKGGSGTFGLNDVTRFTHALESLLDPLRQGTMLFSEGLANLLFRATDVLEELLIAAKSGSESDPASERMLHDLEAALDGAGAREPAAPAVRSVPPPSTGAHEYRIMFAPHGEVFSQGMDPVLLVRNLAALGDVLRCELHLADIPSLAALDPERCYLRWSLQLRSERSEAEVRDVFAFVEDGSRIEIERVVDAATPTAGTQIVLSVSPQAPAIPARAAQAPAPVGREERAEGSKASTLRVSTDKLDRLVNLVGELVIAQSMITQALKDPSEGAKARLEEAAIEMDRNTRELQDLIMSVRMVPMGSVFNRFPRLARDLGAAHGKKIALEIEGQETEIDKGIIEQIADPLTHLIRNAIDHGLETPEQRLLAGKPETGTIHLAAFHQGGSVIIEVRDDGRGLNTERIRQKGLDLGLLRPGESYSEEQVHALIFEPGFSTAAVVSDLSGRGVGMDVVRSNIDALNGSLSLSSSPGQGTRIRLRLPLTLAILEGLSLRVGAHVFVLPLLAIHESFRPSASQLKSVFQRGEVVLVRGEPIPLIRLYDVLGLTPETTDPCRALVVIVETGATKLGLLVDELLGQGQVVVKSLETNYRKVTGVMGATILGDGQVALILDVEGLSRRALGSNRSSGQSADAGLMAPARSIRPQSKESQHGTEHRTS
jgi:two-component system, chemotaxis family, sensor kinase CheA